MKKLIKSLTLIGVAALSLMVSPALQAQTHSEFNTQSSTNGWKFYLPDVFNVTEPLYYSANGAIQPTVTLVTNNISAGNSALFLHAGTTNIGGWIMSAGGDNGVRVGAFYTNGPALGNYTMTGEFFHWTNGQSQTIGLLGRVGLPLPLVPGSSTNTTTFTKSPIGLMLAYGNARSAGAFANNGAGGSGTDRLYMYFVDPDLTGHAGFGQVPIRLEYKQFSGPGEIQAAGASLSPNSTNGHYRLVFTANGTSLTGQIVDLSTGLPMTVYDGSAFGPDNTNMIHATAVFTYGGYTYYLTNNGAIYDNNGVLQAGTNVPMGGAYGFYATMNDGSTAPTPLQGGGWSSTEGQPYDPKFDDFAIVQGVVTLESAPEVTGPYTQDTSAGIEVYPKRITVPTNGSERFYRIHWFNCDHTPTITGVTLGSPVSVKTATGYPATYPSTTTTVVNTLVLTYN